MEKLARLSVSNPTSFSLGANASITGLGDGWYFGLYPESFFSYDIEAPSIEVESGTHLNFSLTGKACRPGEVLRIHGKNSVSSVRAFQKLCEDYPDEEMWLDYLGYPW